MSSSTASRSLYRLIGRRVGSMTVCDSLGAIPSIRERSATTADVLSRASSSRLYTANGTSKNGQWFTHPCLNSRTISTSSFSMHPEETTEQVTEPSAKVKELADRIVELNMMEVSALTDVLKDRLGITGMGSMGMMAPQMFSGTVGGAGGGGEAEVAAVEEKTEFSVKLTGYDAASKIKVIKEVRAVTELGLKEAKEMVEKGEFVLKEGLSKEDAEALVKKLEEVGGVVKME